MTQRSFRQADRNLNAYVDAEHASQLSSRKSISGFVCRLGAQGAFDWSSRSQKMVVRSSTEAEMLALSDNADLLALYRRLMGELRLLPHRPTIVGLTLLETSQYTDDGAAVNVYEDNTSGIRIIQDIVYCGRTKHIDVRMKRVRELVRRGTILLRYLSTRLQLADLLTKGLPVAEHIKFVQVILSGGKPEEECGNGRACPDK